MRAFVFVLVLLFAAASSAEAQRGRAFLNDPVNSPEEYADRIETCRTREEIKKGERSPFINLSCESLVQSFNDLPHFDDVADHRVLADYIRTLSFQPCPPGRRVRIAMVTGTDSVEYMEREFRKSEMCLVDLNQNLYVSSAVCGQWCATQFPYTFTRLVEEEASKPLGPETPIQDSIDKVLRDEQGNPQAPLAVVNKDSEDHPRWWSPRRRSGQVLWGGIGAGLVGAYCATQGCWLMEQTVRVTTEPCGGTCR